MKPSDFRSLIAVCGLSNREAASALALADDRLVRRLKSGDEDATPEIESRLIVLAGDVLAAQMLRSLNLAAGGKVNLATLRISEDVIHVESDLSEPVAMAVRAVILRKLAETGLKIEKR